VGGLTALAVVVVAYTLVASKLGRWWITGPIVFVAAGAILGPGGLGGLPFALGNETVLTITELTLALLLFADASTVRLRDLEGDASLPQRLLFAGLPLTIVVGALLAYLVFPGVGWAVAALIATILAPTDAALGLAVVTNRAVPARIRRALNVESGLNDGIATPFVTLFIAAVAAEEALGDTAWGWQAVKQIGLAIVAAVVVGYLGGKLLAVAAERGWTSEVSEQIAILALALLAYQGSVTLGGNGFIAAFVGGILFGAATRRRLTAPVQFTETLGLSASFLVWSIFGALFVGALLGEDFTIRPVVYAVLSLTVIRMVPVAIALAGTHLRWATVGAERVGHHGGELRRLAGTNRNGPLRQQQHDGARQHREPVPTRMHTERVDAAPNRLRHPHLRHRHSGGAGVTAQQPAGEPAGRVVLRSDHHVLVLHRLDELVQRRSQGAGDRGQLVEADATVTSLQPAQGGGAEVAASREVVERP